MSALKVNNLFRYFGTLKAVNGVTFEIPHGSVCGFVGSNGAGKTTTMRILATLDYPTLGSAEVCGINVVHHPAEVREGQGHAQAEHDDEERGGKKQGDEDAVHGRSFCRLFVIRGSCAESSATASAHGRYRVMDQLPVSGVCRWGGMPTGRRPVTAMTKAFLAS